MQISKSRLYIIIFVSGIFVLSLFVFYNITNSNNKSLQKDPYGDLIETKVSGEPEVVGQKSFVFLRDEYLINNLSTSQIIPLEKSIKYFIWDNINENENKAVMKNGKMEVINNQILYKSEIRTNQNKTGFGLTIYLSNKNDIQKAEVFYDNKTYPLTVQDI